MHKGDLIPNTLRIVDSLQFIRRTIAGFKAMILNVTLEAGPPNWSAACGDDGLGGVVVATGTTRDDAIEEFKSALRFHLDCLRLNGMDVPVIEALEVTELVPV